VYISTYRGSPHCVNESSNEIIVDDGSSFTTTCLQTRPIPVTCARSTSTVHCDPVSATVGRHGSGTMVEVDIRDTDPVPRGTQVDGIALGDQNTKTGAVGCSIVAIRNVLHYTVCRRCIGLDTERECAANNMVSYNLDIGDDGI